MSFPSRGAALVAAAVLAALAATSYLLLTRHGSHSESGPPASRPGATGQTSATPTPSTPSTEAPAVGLKPPIRGLIDPFGLPDHLYAGISRFKRQFGGSRRDSIGAYDHIFYDRLADRLVQRLTPNAHYGSSF